MNNLSWLIYLADRANAIQAMSMTLMVMCSIAFALMTLAVVVPKFEDHLTPIFPDRVLFLWLIPLVFGMIYLITPTSDGIYKIAASETAGVVIQSPEAKEVFTQLKEVIMDSITPEDPPVINRKE